MKRWLTMFALAFAWGCDDSSRKPDTGAGAGQTPPATLNCADLCHRIASCGVTLCNEDTRSNNYDILGPILEDQCEVTCTDALLQSMITSTAWQCIFQSSCREVFDYDTCQGMGHYSC